MPWMLSPVREQLVFTWYKRYVPLSDIPNTFFDESTDFVVSQVIPMLPRLLCEQLCSLNPLTDRLTFSVIWKITPEGKV